MTCFNDCRKCNCRGESDEHKAALPPQSDHARLVADITHQWLDKHSSNLVVDEALAEAGKHYSQADCKPPLNWHTSVVDLLKFLGMSSSVDARREYAKSLNCPPDLLHESALFSMNDWLHVVLLQKLVSSGCVSLDTSKLDIDTVFGLNTRSDTRIAVPANWNPLADAVDRVAEYATLERTVPVVNGDTFCSDGTVILSDALTVVDPNDNQLMEDAIQFTVGGVSILTLTSKGMFYNDQFVEDAGEARVAFVETMEAIKFANKPSSLPEQL